LAISPLAILRFSRFSIFQKSRSRNFLSRAFRLAKDDGATLLRIRACDASDFVP
jgi:hypothetical protein